MRIRASRPGDEPDAYDVCLRTAASGEDATGRYADPDLVGHVFVGPYLRLAPEFAFVVDDGRVSGYIVGTPDTVAFEDACERDWWPALRQRYPDPVAVPKDERSPDQLMRHLIHHPARTGAELTGPYPAHLHINLLPHLQGGGNGGALMRRLLGALAAAGVPGVHLGVGVRNVRAQGFYRAMGFVAVVDTPHSVVMARAIDPRRDLPDH